jgi:hypothetical protein
MSNMLAILQSLSPHNNKAIHFSVVSVLLDV